MRVLYLSYDGLTDPLGQSQILPYLQYLSKQGFQFTILSFEKRERFEKEGDIIRSITDRYNIHWQPLFFTAKPPILSKVYDRFKMIATVKALHKKHSYDLIHCRSYIAAEVGLQLKKKFGVKMLFDMRGFWADEKVDNGQWNLRHLLYRRIYSHYKKKEEEFLLNADGIISLTKAAKDYLLKQKIYQHLNIEVIPCCADLKHFDYSTINNEDISKQKAALGIPSNAKVISYLGSVGGWYMTKEMFQFFISLSRQYPEYVMLLLTKDDPQKVKQEAKKQGVPLEKLFITYSSRQQLPVYLSMCNSSIFFIRNTFSKIASSPTKHAELMGMGVPVICNAIGDTGLIIQTTTTGVLINEFTEEAYANALLQLPALETLDKAYIRKFAHEVFDLETGAKKYYALYNKIMNKNHIKVPATS